ncbi:hypothetical protein EII29_07820 [Leptotrichia sp. OH3620_COT-345]|uniref:hypothetical protein n=1 Tax=Leptotrichia sp. OH3620_COT-345 TaxID=2491048 RepID=UPI000F647D46|nr:hypothetical protein [Leptotrichia sp. OH3620_COT-345]RRD39302.1 hypothetical protein EII29_07820 [Leptotrichia sp. OH3620_COT-345]
MLYLVIVVEKGELSFKENISGMWNMERYINLLMGEIPRFGDDEKGYGPKGKTTLFMWIFPTK